MGIGEPLKKGLGGVCVCVCVCLMDPGSDTRAQRSRSLGVRGFGGLGFRCFGFRV